MAPSLNFIMLVKYVSSGPHAASFKQMYIIKKIAILGPVHKKTIVNAKDSKRKLFYAFRPSVHTKTMKTLTVNA